MKARFVYRAWKARLRDQRMEIAIAKASIHPGDVVVDAGANKGAYLYWLQRFAGEKGTVLAYEPQPELAKYLQKITAELGWRNVQVHSLALSDRVGKSMLHVPGQGVSPGASLESSVLEQSDGRKFECLIDTLDHQLANRRNVRFLKVDVEGHELALFRGASEVLRRDKPTLLFECEGRHLSKHTMKDVFTFLQSFGYLGFLLKEDSLLPVEKFDPAVHQPQRPGDFWNSADYFNNFVFVAGELGGELRGYVRT